MNTKFMNTFYGAGWESKPGEANPYAGTSQEHQWQAGVADRLQDMRNAALSVHGKLEVFKTVSASPCFATYIVTRVPSPSRDYCRYEVRRADHWPHTDCPVVIELTQCTYDYVNCTAHVEAWEAHEDEMELRALEAKYDQERADAINDRFDSFDHE